MCAHYPLPIAKKKFYSNPTAFNLVVCGGKTSIAAESLRLADELDREEYKVLVISSEMNPLSYGICKTTLTRESLEAVVAKLLQKPNPLIF